MADDGPHLLNEVCHNFLANTKGPIIDQELYEITVKDFLHHFKRRLDNWAPHTVTGTTWCTNEIGRAQLALTDSLNLKIAGEKERVQDLFEALSSANQDAVIYLASALLEDDLPHFHKQMHDLMRKGSKFGVHVSPWNSYTRFGVFGKSRGVCQAAMEQIKQKSMCIWASDGNNGGNPVRLIIAGGTRFTRKIHASDEDFRLGGAQIIVTGKRSAKGKGTPVRMLDSNPSLAGNQHHDILILAAYSQEKDLYAVILDPTCAQFSPEKLDEEKSSTFMRQNRLYTAARKTSMMLSQYNLCAVPLAIPMGSLKATDVNQRGDMRDTLLLMSISSVKGATVAAMAKHHMYGKLRNYHKKESVKAKYEPALTIPGQGALPKTITRIEGRPKNKIIFYKNRSGSEAKVAFQALKFVDHCAWGIVHGDETSGGIKRFLAAKRPAKAVKNVTEIVGGQAYKTNKTYKVEGDPYYSGKEIRIVSFADTTDPTTLEPTKKIGVWKMLNDRGSFEVQAQFGRRGPPDLSNIFAVNTAPKPQKGVGLGLPTVGTIQNEETAKRFLETYYTRIAAYGRERMIRLLDEEEVDYLETDALWQLQIKYVDAIYG